MSVRIAGRRLRASTLVLAVAVALVGSACSSTEDTPSLDGGAAVSGGEYAKLVTGGPVASDAEIEANAWAKKIKQQGHLRVGGTDSGPIFSLKNLETGVPEGFDAGLSQLLAHYITGGTDLKTLTKLTISTTDTRETLLQNNSVDAVFATYTITEARAEKVAFAGPYYASGDAILVKKGNTSIKGVGDLDGKTVATQSNSTAALALKKLAPKANVLLFKDDAQCVAAVQQGRADAYVLDQSILVANALSNKAVEVVPGDPFTTDPYGIGLNKDGDAKPFVNAFLAKIYASGDWAKLWKATIGTVIPGEAPAPPVLGSAAGS